MSNSAWSPLQHPVFRAIWIAGTASNIGTWMQNVGGTWLMTSLTTSAVMVALMQTASSLPVFLIGLPAGALADIVDRRRILIFSQAWMLIAAALLGVLTVCHLTTPWILLGLTFAIGLGGAIGTPAWQATTRQIVPRSELPAAVALGGVGINVARAVGPALGGLVVSAAGPGAVFLLNAASFIVTVVIFYRWKPDAPNASALPTERLIGAMRAGARYARHAPALRAVLIRVAVFVSCGSGLWALLPLVARHELHLSSGGYGVLLGCIGVGAISGAAVMPRFGQNLSMDQRLVGATLIFAAATLLLGIVHSLPILCLAMTAAGVGWIALMSGFNVSAQTSVPIWVQARALGIYLLVFQGGLGLGSILWGAVAGRIGNGPALDVSALGLTVGLVATRFWRLNATEKLDVSPSPHWPEPSMSITPNADQGPVLVQVEYQIDPEQSSEFTKAMRAMQRLRRRDGAYYWGLFGDLAMPSRYVETFMVESWAEHLRQHERVTAADRAYEDHVHSFQRPDIPIAVSHFLAESVD